MVDILLRLKAMEIVALPIHDAILVPQSKADIAEQVMLDTFLQHTSVPGVVTIEGGGSGLYSSLTLPDTQVTPQVSLEASLTVALTVQADLQPDSKSEYRRVQVAYRASCVPAIKRTGPSPPRQGC